MAQGSLDKISAQAHVAVGHLTRRLQPQRRILDQGSLMSLILPLLLTRGQSLLTQSIQTRFSRSLTDNVIQRNKNWLVCGGRQGSLFIASGKKSKILTYFKTRILETKCTTGWYTSILLIQFLQHLKILFSRLSTK